MNAKKEKDKKGILLWKISIRIFQRIFCGEELKQLSQADGAYREDGKGLNPQMSNLLKDFLMKKFKNRSTRDDISIAMTKAGVTDQEQLLSKRQFGIDFYHTYENDIDLLSEMGFKTFRTSLDWSRIFPNGDDEEPNVAALEHYSKMIDYLLSKNIEPIITMNHYETPLNITFKYGGWPNKDVIPMFEKFGKTLLDWFYDASTTVVNPN